MHHATPAAVAKAVQRSLSARLTEAQLPPEFFGSWEHCSGSRKSVLSHSVGLGLLSAAVADLAAVEQVAIDARLKTWREENGEWFRETWQPDVVGYRREGDEFIPVVYADFESPNSSDARVPHKDLGGYRRWIAGGGKAAPYVLAVCLPRKEAGYWPLRYTKGCNTSHAGRLKELREMGPFAYWTQAWKSELIETGYDLVGITILNVGDGVVRRLRL